MFLALILILCIGPGIYVGWRRFGEASWAHMEWNREHYGILYRDKPRIPDSEDRWCGFLHAVLGFGVWPLFVVYWVVGNNHLGFSKLAYTPPKYREELFKERIRELEKQVGI